MLVQQQKLVLSSYSGLYDAVNGYSQQLVEGNRACASCGNVTDAIENEHKCGACGSQTWIAATITIQSELIN